MPAALERATEAAINAARAKAEVQIGTILGRLQHDTGRRIEDLQFHSFHKGQFVIEICLIEDSELPKG